MEIYELSLVKSDFSSEPAYSWQGDAACIDSDPNLFEIALQGDPKVNGMSREGLKLYNNMKIAEALSLCLSCPVKKKCLETATKEDTHWTVRGGQPPKGLTNVDGITFIRDIRGRLNTPPRDRKTHCKRGHEDWVTRKTGKRVCRTCINLYERERSQRRRDEARVVGSEV